MQYDLKNYYRNNAFHGVIGTKMEGDLMFIVSAAYSNDFTIGMLRDIISLSKQHDICIVADSPEYQESVARSLSRWDCEYEYIEGVMFAYHTKD